METKRRTRRSRADDLSGPSPQIMMMAIDQIAPDPKNPRIHDRQQLRAIARSIETFGFNAPILVRSDNQIVAGHGRLEAAKLLQMTEVPVIRLDHLTGPQARAYLIADNKLSERSRWDDQHLAEYLKALQETALEFDLDATGFELPEIDLRIQSLNPIEGADEADEFEVGDDPQVAAPGDLWILGKHRIICGNALTPQTYAALMGDQRAGAVFTDPPFNLKIHGHVSGKGRRRHREFDMASGEMTRTEFEAFLAGWLSLATAYSEDSAVQFMCMDWRHIGEAVTAIDKAGHELINLCVWAKTNGGMGSLYRSRHELVFVYRRQGQTHRNNVQLGVHGRNRTNVWNYPGATSFSAREKNKAESLHPTVKPIALVADAILDVTAPGEIVLDPFLGSGTTLLAAERTGRRGYGIELDPQYVDLAIRRWQRMTKEVVRLSDGRTFDEVRLARLSDPSAAPSDLEA